MVTSYSKYDETLNGAIHLNRYKALFFDIDDTLLDFRKAESDALRLLLKEQRILYTPQAEAHYKTINQNLWKSFEMGEISRDEVINTRFLIFLKNMAGQWTGLHWRKPIVVTWNKGTKKLMGHKNW